MNRKFHLEEPTLKTCFHFEAPRLQSHHYQDAIILPQHTHTHAITCWMNFLTFADMFTVICNMKRSAKGADPLLKRTSSLSRITKVSKRRGAGSRCVRQTCIDLNRPFLPSVFACSERVHQGRPTTVNPSLCLRHH